MQFSSIAVLAGAAMLLPAALPAQKTITGQAAFADWNQQQPGETGSPVHTSSR